MDGIDWFNLYPTDMFLRFRFWEPLTGPRYSEIFVLNPTIGIPLSLTLHAWYRVYSWTDCDIPSAWCNRGFKPIS